MADPNAADPNAAGSSTADSSRANSNVDNQNADSSSGSSKMLIIGAVVCAIVVAVVVVVLVLVLKKGGPSYIANTECEYSSVMPRFDTIQAKPINLRPLIVRVFSVVKFPSEEKYVLIGTNGDRRTTHMPKLNLKGASVEDSCGRTAFKYSDDKQLHLNMVTISLVQSSGKKRVVCSVNSSELVWPINEHLSCRQPLKLDCAAQQAGNYTVYLGMLEAEYKDQTKLDEKYFDSPANSAVCSKLGQPVSN